MCMDTVHCLRLLGLLVNGRPGGSSVEVTGGAGRAVQTLGWVGGSLVLGLGSGRGGTSAGSSRLGCGWLLGHSWLFCGLLLLGVARRQIGRGSSRGSRRGDGRDWRGCVVARSTNGILDHVPPLFSIGWGVGFEVELGGGVEGIADLAGGHVLALDGELDAVDGTDDTVGQVQR